MQYEYQCILLIRLGFSGDQNMICEWKNNPHLGHARNLNKWPNWAAVVGSIMGKASRQNSTSLFSFSCSFKFTSKHRVKQPILGTLGRGNSDDDPCSASHYPLPHCLSLFPSSFFGGADMQPALMENLQLALRPPPPSRPPSSSPSTRAHSRSASCPVVAASLRPPRLGGRRRRPCPPSPPLNSTSKFSVPFCFCPVKTQPAG